MYIVDIMANTNHASKLEEWPIEKVFAYRGNARVHPPDQIRKIASSILRFGFNAPILVDESSGVIIAGHGRLDAAKSLGLTKVPVVPIGHLSESQRRAYTIADNRLAEDAGWDAGVLAKELAALAADGFSGLQDLGFTADELRVMTDLDFDEDEVGSGIAQGGKPKMKTVRLQVGEFRVDISELAYQAWLEDRLEKLGSMDAVRKFVAKSLDFTEAK
jgi:hypothetical protein